MRVKKLSGHFTSIYATFYSHFALCQKICKTINRFPPISQDLKNWSQVKPGYVQSLRSCTDYGRVGLLKSSPAHPTGSQ